MSEATATDTDVQPEPSEDVAEQPLEETTELVADEDQADEADEEQGEESSRRGREEAKLRKRAQAAEAERDELAQRVEALQRQHVETLVAASGVKPPAVWAVVNGVADLIDPETGAVSADAVADAIKTAAAQLGVTPGISKGAMVPGLGNRPANKPETGDPWSQAFEVKRSR